MPCCRAGSLSHTADGTTDRNALLDHLSTFAPPGWCVHLERIADEDTCRIVPGQVVFASYVPEQHLAVEMLPHFEGGESEDDSDDPDDAMLQDVDDVLSSLSAGSSPGRGPSDETSVRSRSPYRSPSPVAPTEAQVHAPFLLLAQEYTPERVLLPFVAGTTVPAAMAGVQALRDPAAARRFDQLVPASPQTVGAYALVVAKPSWSNDVFAIFDCSYVNGAVFCWVVSPVMNRASILAVAGVQDDASYEVYVPDSDAPLAPADTCRLNTGDCISVVPGTCPVFVVSSLADMLQSIDGWDPRADLPCVEGEWLHLLTDTGPCCISTSTDRRRYLRQDITAALAMSEDSAAIQSARPPVTDFSDSGRLATNVIAATQDFPVTRLHDSGRIYFVDLRPILCGMSWAFSPNGLVSTATIRAHGLRRDLLGYRVAVQGGRRVHPDDDDEVEVLPGEVLVVTYVCDSHNAQQSRSPASSGALPVDTGDGAPGPTAHDDMALRGATSSVPSQNDSATSSELPPHNVAGACGPSESHHNLRPSPWPCLPFGLCLLCLLLVHDPCAGAALFFSLIGKRQFGLYMLLLWNLQRAPVALSVQRQPLSSRIPISAEHTAFDALAHHNIPRIPTPCRGRLASARGVAPEAADCSSIDALDTGELCTLLQESVALQGQNFCDTVYADLVWLCASKRQRGDPCHDAGVSATLGESPSLRTKLDLESLLALPHVGKEPSSSQAEVFDLDARQCWLPGTQEAVDRLLQKVAVRHLQGVPSGLEKPERFTDWILRGWVGRAPAPGEILVLTADGSYHAAAQRVGWGVVVSIVSGDLLRLPGQFVGCVFGDLSSLLAPAEANRVRYDAYSAEVAGLTWAAVAALQLAVSCPIVIRADNISALDGAQGKAALRDDGLCRMARGLHAAAGVLLGPALCYQHVEGHAGDPANELADALANLGAGGSEATTPLYFQPVSAEGGFDLLRWLPHICLSRVRAQEVPGLQDHVLIWSRGAGVCVSDPEAVMRPFLRAFPPAVPSEATALPPLNVSVLVASFNVLSLQDCGPEHPQSSGLHGMTGKAFDPAALS